MKVLSIIALLLLFAAPYAYAGGEGKHLFILSGQSNMEGLQPDKSFTPAVIKEFGRDNVIVVLDAKGSRAIRCWYKDWKPEQGDTPKATGYIYDRLMNKVRLATNYQDPQTITFVWMQGEDDAREGHGDVYADSLRGLFEQLRTDLGRDDVNFVIGRISDYDLDNSEYPHWTLVRQAQVEVAESEPRTAWVDTDDLNDGKSRRGKDISNALHYSAQGYITLGHRFAQTSIELIAEHSREQEDADDSHEDR
jgi:hypothetical protein